MTLTRREQIRINTTQEIKTVARKQMLVSGAASLSLRAIAREMGISAPALYRYFENRDALVTALILDAYNALADAMIAADAAMARDDYNGRFQTITHAYRNWAKQNPSDFTLIYGTPIPGYHAPRQLTTPAAVRSQRALGQIFGDAWQAGNLQAPTLYTNLPPAMADVITTLADQESQEDVPPIAITLTIYVWTRLYGLVWGEFYGHYPPGFAETGDFFEIEIAAMAAQLGLTEIAANDSNHTNFRRTQ